MLGGYIDFFMDPSLAECYLNLKEEVDKLVQKKVKFLECLNYYAYAVQRDISSLSL